MTICISAHPVGAVTNQEKICPPNFAETTEFFSEFCCAMAFSPSFLNFGIFSQSWQFNEPNSTTRAKSALALSYSFNKVYCAPS
jgi:hypothetical protein